MPEHDLVDIGGRDAGIGERIGRHPHDQALDGFAFELAERRMRPSDDAGGHGDLLLGDRSYAVARYAESHGTPCTTFCRDALGWAFTLPSNLGRLRRAH